jgi:hypothetical protein
LRGRIMSVHGHTWLSDKQSASLMVIYTSKGSIHLSAISGDLLSAVISTNTFAKRERSRPTE